ncbi:CoA-transferase [Candidatus Uabimicrobium sp. HlEnr_7]|uniref:CoA-transferase n=1 Tax=Candidatus Uabimicrobium helgolandensis TaxID=3095367 RepID=UPI00355834D2
MNIFSKLNILYRVLKWRFTWNKRDIDYKQVVEGNDKFISARQAVKFIKDNDVCMVAGLAGNQRISVLSWALAERFQKENHPQNLTLITPGGQGGRGRVPGTLEEWALKGLVSTLVSAHHETYRAFLELADENGVELQCIPQGLIAVLVEAQSKGEKYLSSETGIGTFCDPRVSGSCVVDPTGKNAQLIEVDGDKLKYHLPQIDVALFNAPSADKEGNIYVENSATICESKYAALAAHKNGGKVIANVGQIIEKNEDNIYIPADLVDAVVVNPITEQTGVYPHLKYSKHLTVHPESDLDYGIEMIRLVNRIAGITPKRGKKDFVLARLGAKVLTEAISKGAYINIGTGLPEEVCYNLYKNNCLDDIQFFTEAGAIGGIPAPGVFFGAAAAPEQIISSPEIFHQAYSQLDATILGFLQVDSKGDVNSSRKRAGAQGFVGPGGFMDFTSAAKNVVFTGSWMKGGKIKITKDKVTIVKKGTPKFIEKVQEITFNGDEGLRKNQQVFFATHVGVFVLAKEGITLKQVMPGIDIQKDILDFSPMKILVADDCTEVDRSIISGERFSLEVK